jgi:hypothetical protein
MQPLADNLPQRRFPIVNVSLIVGFVVASILVNSGHLTRMKRSGWWAAA